MPPAAHPGRSHPPKKPPALRSGRGSCCWWNQLRDAIQLGQFQQPRGSTAHRKTLAGCQRMASALQQNRQRRGVKLLKRTGIGYHFRGPGKQLGFQAAGKPGRHGVGQDRRKRQHGSIFVQDFFSPAFVFSAAFDLLRWDSAAISPSTPFVEISCANWVR